MPEQAAAQPTPTPATILPVLMMALTSPSPASTKQLFDALEQLLLTKNPPEDVQLAFTKLKDWITDGMK